MPDLWLDVQKQSTPIDSMAIITCVAAHVDHGKTTLMDSIVSASGSISRASAGELRYLDTREDEQMRGITLKLSAVTVEGKNSHVIIDTPGHVDFEHLVQKAAVLADNFVVLIDVNEGITPRMYAFANYMQGKNTVLVLNKIDKAWHKEFEEFYGLLLDTLAKMNGLAKADIFDWKKNNVILACSTLCSGINYEVFNDILCTEMRSKNSLRNASMFVYTLRRRIQTGNVDGIIAKYNLRKKSEKHMFSNILPLANCVLSSIEHVEAFSEHYVPCTHCAESIDVSNPEVLLGITSFCVLRETTRISAEDVLFVTRLFVGTLKVGARVFSCTKAENRECIVEKIFLFGVNDLIETSCASSPALVCIKGCFQKNSVISSTPVYCSSLLPVEKTPFFRSKIRLRDMNQLEAFKAALKTLSFSESPLRAKLNKYSEFELACQGQVHLEKIAKDLEAAGFFFDASDFEPLFAEVPTLNARRVLCCETGMLSVDIEPIMAESSIFTVKGINADVATSVLNLFMRSGPLIGEKICFSKITVEADYELDSFSSLKKIISDVFLETAPKIVPFYFASTCFVSKEYLGQVYSTLSRFNFVMDSDEFDTRSQFFVIRFLIPQLHYGKFVDEVRIATRGTVYLEFSEHGFYNDKNVIFNNLICQIRKSKGLFVEEKLVTDPEKQRTLKK